MVEEECLHVTVTIPTLSQDKCLDVTLPVLHSHPERQHARALQELQTQRRTANNYRIPDGQSAAQGTETPTEQRLQNPPVT
jgi:ERCC4-type nuclease